MKTRKDVVKEEEIPQDQVMNSSRMGLSTDVLSRDDKEANEYTQNCRKFDVKIDPSILITLKTGWDILQPAGSFSEGGILPLFDVLKTNKTIKRINFATTSLYDSRYRSYGTGNATARLLKFILHQNDVIQDINLASSGLNDDGIKEIADGIKYNKSIQKLNLSYNTFGEKGAEKLKEALIVNDTLRHLDLSNNALGFQSIDSLVKACKCQRKNLIILTNGNYVFEEILNSVSHGICFLVSIVGACLLVTEAADEETYSPYHFWSCVLYSFSLTFLFISSCLFHSFFMLPQASRILQILDHVGIYFLIAGSYTPFLLIGAHDNMIARFIITAEWVMAIFGAGFAAISDFNDPTTTIVELSLFVLMGIGPVFFWNIITAGLAMGAIYLYVGGGVTYLTGIIFFILGETNPTYHVIWHLFVAVAATLHWFLIYIFILNTDISSMKNVVTDALHILHNVSGF